MCNTIALLFYTTFSKILLQHTHIHNINSQRFFVHEDTVSRPKISLFHVSQIARTNDENSIKDCTNMARIFVSWKGQRGRLWNMSFFGKYEYIHLTFSIQVTF